MQHFAVSSQLHILVNYQVILSQDSHALFIANWGGEFANPASYDLIQLFLFFNVDIVSVYI